MANFHQFFCDQVIDMVTRSNDKYSCIEDQFYYADRFPIYKQDDVTVFRCNACNALLHVSCLTECDECEKNFCDFKHTDKSVCHEQHNCAKANLRRVTDPFLAGNVLTVCTNCSPSNRNIYRRY